LTYIRENFQDTRTMTFDLSNHLGCMTRVVRDLEWEGKPAKAILASRTFDTDAADLWDAVTNPARIPRWLGPISGELRLGGSYQIEGNASGTITACDPPSRLALTWEFAGQVSWVAARLVPEADRTRLELEHWAHVDLENADDHWNQFGPGAGGVGWELGFVGLARHVAEPEATSTADEGLEWMVSAEAKEFYRIASEAWACAAIAAGEPEEVAMAAAERNRAFYSGEGSLA
jgi:uncharacterized protein YndB with AHSA1/START domain